MAKTKRKIVKKKTKTISKIPKEKKTTSAKIKKAKKSSYIETEFDVMKHSLVPKHTILSEKDKKELFEKYHITIKELPKIMITDPAIQHLKPKLGNIVKIERKSSTAGESTYYRGIVNE